jgi:cytidine deaminase
MKISPTVEKAYRAALDSRSKAYAPYSNFLVGAALKAKNSDVIIAGHNIENASYPGCICAERTALYSAISQHNIKEFEFIVIVTQCEPAGTPCGFCLQALSEFVDANFKVYLAGLNGVERELKFSELMPHPFDKTKL